MLCCAQSAQSISGPSQKVEEEDYALNLCASPNFDVSRCAHRVLVVPECDEQRAQLVLQLAHFEPFKCCLISGIVKICGKRFRSPHFGP